MCRLKTTWSQFVHLSKSAREQSLAPPPIAPSNPAPGRRLLILRDNSQVTGVQFLSFDDLAGPSSSRFPSPGERPLPTSTVRDELAELGKWDAPAAARGGPVEKKRWALLRNIRAFSGLGGSSSNSSGSSSSNSSDASKSKAGEEMAAATSTSAVTSATVRTTRQDTGRRRDASVSPERSRRAGAAAAAAAAADVSASAGAGAAAVGAAASNAGAAADVRSSFRFSLEWVERAPNNSLGRLYPPSLPLATQDLLAAAAPAAAAAASATATATANGGLSAAAEARRTDLRGADANAAGAAATTGGGQLGIGGGGVVPLSVEARKYVGRALAEWTLVVSECQGFFERRRSEGIASNALVETPTLSVDWFRRLG